jgi:hypothetical protein
MNRYHLLKAGLIGAALCMAIAGSSLGPTSLRPHLSNSPFTAAETMQAGFFHAGARLGHVALWLFSFAR